MLKDASASPFNILRHFVFEGGILVAAIVVGIAYRGAAMPVHKWSPVYEQVGFGITTFLVLWGLFTALELMKLILGIALTSTTLFALPNDNEHPDQPGSDAGARQG